MTLSHLTGVVAAALLTASSAVAQIAPPAQPDTPGSSYLVFLRGQPVGREDVAIVRQPDGWVVRGSSRLGQPIDITSRVAEVTYDLQWQPKTLLIDGVVRGQDMTLKTTFAGGKANSVILVQGNPQSKADDVSADTIVLPNTFLGAYAALARRLQGKAAGAAFKGYIAPQAELPITVEGVTSERIDTPKAAINASHFTLQVVNPPPAGPLTIHMWIDPQGNLLRMSIPAQTLELAREDVASAASRTASFTAPGDEPVTIPAAGFNLAGTLTRPVGATGLLPAVVLIGGSGPTDRDETVAGIPIFGQIARELSAAGFMVVRYDKRGIGQSGGRSESATLSDFAEDARAVVQWLDKRKDVDRKRIAIVGHSEGAAVAMILADRERGKVSKVVLAAGVSGTGAELILEQQKHALEGSKLTDAEKAERVALQQKIHDAVLNGGSWEGVPEPLRKAADTPWFQSFLSFDAAKAMKDLRQPILVVQGELDTQVPPHHADTLAELGRARKRQVDTEEVKVPGVNHLLVPAKTGEVAEYQSLGPDAQVSKAVTDAIAAFLKR